MQVGKPIQLRWKLLLQHEVVVIVSTEGASKKNNQLVRPRHDWVVYLSPADNYFASKPGKMPPTQPVLEGARPWSHTFFITNLPCWHSYAVFFLYKSPVAR